MIPTTVSLFCGAGGESAGKELAFRDLGIDTTSWASHAINHWDLAVATHGANFPRIHVHQEDITACTAATFGVKHIDLLWASPSCVHHSRARGGKPCEDQQRSHADEVVDRWLRVGTVVAGGIKHGLVAAHMMSIDQQSTGASACRPMEDPLSTATTKARHALVAAFIQHYYGTGGQHQDPGQPLHTITTLARHGLVTVEIDGETYVITDIGMRMLEPKELATAMGFPADFRWTGEGGKPLTKRDTVKMIGNACPVHTVCELIKAVVLQRPAAFGMPGEAIA